jgi:hypothetical protein
MMSFHQDASEHLPAGATKLSRTLIPKRKLRTEMPGQPLANSHALRNGAPLLTVQG